MEGVGDLIDVTPPTRPGHGRWGWTASGPGPRSRCTGWSTRPTRSTRATRRPRGPLGGRAQDAHQGGGPGPAVRRGDGRGDQRPGRPGHLRPRRHEHGAVGPRQEGRGGQEPYGSMLRQVKLAGGKVKGVLWYQGESDADRRTPPRRTRRSSPTSSPPSAPTSTSPSCRSTSSRSAGSSTPATPRAGTPCRTPSG